MTAPFREAQERRCSPVPLISVIIPTRALATRSGMLRRAIASVLSQEGVTATPIVVINGSEWDKALTAGLRADPRIRSVMLAEADLPGAIRAGRDMVDTPYFTELDDDDLLLPGALSLRVRVLTLHDGCDVVVTNGILRGADGDRLHIRDAASIHRDPLRAFLGRNWLLPGSWLGRTDRVGADVFDGMPRFRECTYLAVRFATAYRMTFVETPTVVYNLQTPRSESKSRDYVLGSLAATRRILELELPADVRASFRKRLAPSCLTIAGLYRRERRMPLACLWYLRSCCQPGGPVPMAQRLWQWLRGAGS